MRLCISKSYKKKRVFEGLALDITEGEITCILGQSGVGKTTLLRILAGLTDFEGEADLPKRVAYVFQEPRLLPWLSVAENLAYVGGRYEDMDGVLEKLSLTELRDTKVNKLSGGEKQRVALARAFLSDAEVMLMDEPFSSVDTALKIRLCEAFARLWQEKKNKVVAVTHDIEEALMLGHRIVVLKDGAVALDIRPKREAFPARYGAPCAEREILLNTVLEEK